MKDILCYAGKTVAITGCFSGMGEAAARLLVEMDAEVHALDYKEVALPVKQYIETDLRDPASIEAAAAKLPDSIDVLLHCAGLPGAPFSNLDTMLVNFVGQRHLNEILIPRLPSGGAVAAITSVAGMGWKNNLDNVNALLATAGFEEGRTWCEANPDAANGYLFSKQCIIAYTKHKAMELAPREIRINCLSPAPTDTPMLGQFHAQVSKEFLEEHFLAPVGRNATSEEMAEPLLFLGSNAARFISGHNLFVDFAYVGATEVGLIPSLLG